MGAPILSGDLSAALNDEIINETFEIIRSNRPGLLQITGIGGEAQAFEGHKMGWLDMRLDAQGSALTSAINDSVTTVPVTDGSIFRVGMVVSADGSDEVMLVTAVSSNNLTVVRGFGNTDGEAVSNGVQITVDSVGREENSTAALDGIFQPEKRENYFQTMDTAIELSRRSKATAQFGDTNDLSFQLARRLEQLNIQMNRALLRGVRMEQTINGNTHTYTGGIKYWLGQTGAINTDNSAAALTLGQIDALSASVVARGGNTDTIVVSINKARELQALINANYTSQRLSEVISDRGDLTMLASDLPTIGNVNRIVVDTNMNNNELILLDSSRLTMRPMAANNAPASGALRTVDATTPGQDGERVRILGDFAVEARDSQTNMARLHNIA